MTTLLALLVHFVLTLNVGFAQTRHKVAAPAVSGHPAFERAFRVQMNTLEQLVLLLPSLWLFALVPEPRVGISAGRRLARRTRPLRDRLLPARRKASRRIRHRIDWTAILRVGAAYGVVRSLPVA